MTQRQQKEKEAVKKWPQQSYWLAGCFALVALVSIGILTFFIGGIVGLPSEETEPTNTPLPPPVVNIQTIKAQAQLTTVEYSTVTEIYNETPPEGWVDELLGNKEQLLLLVYGDVRAGFDLNKLDEDAIWTDGTRVRLVLPAPEILTTNIDFERTHVVYYENNLIFDDNNPNLQGEALRQAKAAVNDAALQADVLQQANTYGQLYFENFLYSLGFTDVEVVVDAQIFRE
jgi:hypothetical protein